MLQHEERLWAPAARRRGQRYKASALTQKEYAQRFRNMIANVGLTPASAAALLHVHSRTLEKWVNGSIPIPYMAYKLIRLLRWYELPGPWKGWQIAGGLLWSPEGRSFKPRDIEHLGLLVRKAALFKQLYDEVAIARRVAAGMSPELPPDNFSSRGIPPHAFPSRGRLKKESAPTPVQERAPEGRKLVGEKA